MIQSLIAIDPGEEAGVAVFQARQLTNVYLIKTAVATTWEWEGPVGLPVICEVPQHYKGSAVSPRDLITLAFTAGYLAKAMRPKSVAKVFPRDWKGQRPKKIDNAYTLSLLDAAEARVIERALHIPQAQRHNVLDAVGIGLWALGRR